MRWSMDMRRELARFLQEAKGDYKHQADDADRCHSQTDLLAVSEEDLRSRWRLGGSWGGQGVLVGMGVRLGTKTVGCGVVGMGVGVTLLVGVGVFALRISSTWPM